MYQTLLCAVYIASLGPATIWEGKNQLTLPPRSERYLIGAIAETAEGERFLAVNGYRLRHERLEAALATAKDLGEIGDYRYRWMGELRLRNPLAVTAPGLLVEANETAGLYAGFLAEGATHHENNVATLDADYHRLIPSELGPSRLWPHEISNRLNRHHLWPGLDTLIEQIASNQELNELGENYRHFIPSSFAKALARMQMALVNDERNLSPAQRIYLLENIARDPMLWSSVKLYVNWRINDGAQVANPDFLFRCLAHAEHGQLRLGEWYRFHEVLDGFTDSDPVDVRASIEAAETQIIRLRSGMMLASSPSLK